MTLYPCLNDPGLIAARDAWFGKLQSLFDGTYREPRAFVLNGVLAHGKSDSYTHPEQWVDECLADIAENKADAIRNDKKFVPVCVEFGPYGVHYIDKILGAEVFFQDGQWYNRYLTTPIGELPEPDLDNNETFQLSIRAAKRFAEVGGAFPLYGLPTIASTLNIAVNLYGQEILVEMLADPDNARRDLETINRTLIRIHEAFRAILPKEQLQPVISWARTQPPGYGQLCGCTTQLLSGELYRDMIADLDEDLLNVYEHGGMIHLCGSHAQHIGTFRNMKSLKALQLNDRASEDLQLYFDGLRDDQMIYLCPCEGMTIEQAMEITGGRRLVICAGVEGEIKLN
ncbi:MAG: hypothetical protein J6C42_07510 [Clostridia bacterium]|nr:hypothetical protein [Clostridia bacterium]